MTTPLEDVDAVLRKENLPTYTEVITALKNLALEVGLAPRVDTHVVYKTWSILDRVSELAQKRTP